MRPQHSAPPPSILAATVLPVLIGVVWIFLTVTPDANGVRSGLILPAIGVFLAGFTAFCVWQGKRRGNQLVAVLFSVIPCLGALTSARLSLVTAAMGVAIILLVTVPRESRRWFGFGA